MIGLVDQGTAYRPYRPQGFWSKLPGPALVGLAPAQAVKLRAFSPNTSRPSRPKVCQRPLGIAQLLAFKSSVNWVVISEFCSGFFYPGSALRS
jgi:hypothetical protein